MNLTISKTAAKWYKEELSIDQHENIRFFVRYGGIGGLIPGFSLGIQFDTPEEIYTSTTVDNITFFIEQKDAWYFGDNHLKIHLNHKWNEPEFIYKQ